MDLNAEPLRHFLTSKLSAYREMLEDWVAVNSFTANRDGVNALGELTAQAFSALGFRCERVPSQNPDFGDHFILARAGSGSTKIGLVSHLDTVFPADEEAANCFAWRVAGERVYGPGTVDIKGGTLMIYMVLDALQAHFVDLFEAVNWLVLLDASEETLSADFGRLCLDRLSGARACLVFEGGYFEDDSFKLVQMRKGMAKFRIRVKGKAAHAGVAHADGANAIVTLSETIAAIAGFTDYDRDLTFNIGYVNGGTVPNRVPHYAEALGEMRAFEMEAFNEGVAKLRALETDGSANLENGPDGLVSVDIFETTAPWPLNPGTNALIDLWRTQAEQLGWQIYPEARGGLSDGNHTWSQIPTLDGLGPMGGNAHCSEHSPAQGKMQEYLSLPSLVPKTILNVLGIVGLVGQ